jgi:anionic cell wall polymer biosynthesis LytR-Cps2A-Psr (LCP) family protein
MKKWKVWLFTILMCLLSVNAGCATVAKDFTASTTAGYHAPDGTALDYTSSKNQENFKADITIDPATGKLTGLHVETTATTPEAAITATAKANAAMAALLEKVLGMVPASALAGS